MMESQECKDVFFNAREREKNPQYSRKIKLLLN